jgi:hypothetical protein
VFEIGHFPTSITIPALFCGLSDRLLDVIHGSIIHETKTDVGRMLESGGAAFVSPQRKAARW